uniref:Macaca fascicularis brain cDNA clone: QflA-13734, similar to human COP9 constitutive photomorphogenic homolog subunit 7A(Arabidopsis) (COPS7A), mRNA, RefSeq: NM_016319.1 n=1 Tax=Macaca fascicularis TaxID=9541 RepID=I7GKH6_MACFA|nr:unnamed protein product [Macaca fascicularis]
MPYPPPIEQPLKSRRAPTFTHTLRILGASLPFQESLDMFILESCHTTVVSFPLSGPWVLGLLLLQPQSLRMASRFLTC